MHVHLIRWGSGIQISLQQRERQWGKFRLLENVGALLVFYAAFAKLLWPVLLFILVVAMCIYEGRVYADGDSTTAAPRASGSRPPAGRQLRGFDVVIDSDYVITLCRDVTTSAAPRRRQARRRTTSHVAASTNCGRSSHCQ